MNINRNNYELFFLLYADKELSETERQEVEIFAAAHPDLKAELDMLLLAVLPDEAPTVFMDKESLFRTTDTASLVNMTNYEGYFVKYADNELSNAGKAATEAFVYKHPECQEEFELIQQTRLSPDTSIQFPDKSLLYRHEESKRRPVLVMWMRFAAAAVVIIIAGLFWMQQRQVNPASDTQAIAGKVQPQQPATDTNSRINIQPEPVNAQQRQIAKTTTDNPVGQPKKNKVSRSHNEPGPAVQPQLLASNDPGKTVETQIAVKEPAEITALNTPAIQISQSPVTETALPQNQGFASKAATEDYIYVDNTPEVRKSPLRGLLRKASRYVEQKNPLSPDHRKGGVFTASQE